MFKLKQTLLVSFVVLTMVCASAPIHSQQRGAPRLTPPDGDVAFELIGQVTNIPSTPNSIQYGYLSTINGLSADQIFTTAVPTAQNQTTALFTFYTEAATSRAIGNDGLNTINRTGTTTIYFDATPDGDFANPDSFRDGTPVLVMTLRQQVIVDTAERTFTVVNVNTVTSADDFSVGAESFRLGKRRDQFRTSLIGRLNAVGAPPPTGFFSGHAIAIERAERE